MRTTAGMVVCWAAALAAVLAATGVAGADVIGYHRDPIGGVSWTSSGYAAECVRFDLPQAGTAYRVDAIGVYSEGEGATFPAGTRIVIRLFDAAGGVLYTSEEFDLSGENASSALRVFDVSSAGVVVTDGFYGGFEQRGEGFTFGVQFDYPHGWNYGRSYKYKNRYEQWYEEDQDLMIDAYVSLAPTKRPGDCDEDGDVDVCDYIALKRNFGAGPDATWAQGNFDDDGVVGFTDYQALQAGFDGTPDGAGEGQAPQPVPEPATIALLAMGSMVWVRRRR